MAGIKYVKFNFTNGYAGCDVHDVVEVPENISDKDLGELLDAWGHEQSRDEWWYSSASETDIEDYGVSNRGEYSEKD